MNDFLQQLRNFYEGLDPSRRRVLGGVLVLAAAFIIGVGVWASQPQQVTLTRIGSGDDLSAMTQALSRSGISWSLGTDGQTIQVSAVDEIAARKAMSAEGILIGLEGIEKLEPWATPFKEQMYKQLMLQNELVRSINGIDGISASKVHLNLPARSEFLRDEVRATASVTIRPDAGGTVSRDTARSIARLVSNAVNGMTAEDVTVIDVSDGRTVWGGETASEDQDLNRLTARREIEMSESVRTVLGRMLGTPDALSVSVSVELETSSVQSTVQAIDPKTSTPAEERLSTQVNGTTQQAPVGVPGTDANLPERTNGTQSGTSGSKSETQATTYDYTRTTTTTTKPAGSIRRVSASVMINSDAVQAIIARAAADGNVDPAAVAAMQADLEEAVRAALGYSPERGDQVVVKFARFAEVELDATESTPTMAILERQASNILLAVALILGFLLVIRPLMTFLLAGRPTPVSGQALAGAANSLPGGIMAANAPMPPGSESTEALTNRLRLAVENFESLNAQDLSELVSREPEHSAEVLRRWIRS